MEVAVTSRGNESAKPRRRAVGCVVGARMSHGAMSGREGLKPSGDALEVKKLRACGLRVNGEV
jgi:hypothetical protein